MRVQCYPPGADGGAPGGVRERDERRVGLARSAVEGIQQDGRTGSTAEGVQLRRVLRVLEAPPRILPLPPCPAHCLVHGHRRVCVRRTAPERGEGSLRMFSIHVYPRYNAGSVIARSIMVAEMLAVRW